MNTTHPHLRGMVTAIAMMVVIGWSAGARASNPLTPDKILAPTILSGNSGHAVGHVQDSTKPGVDPRKLDSLNKARQDSINREMHKQDSIKHAAQDSLNREKKKRDSLDHARTDSLIKANHRRDSLEHKKRDSLIHEKRDSIGRGGKRDSVIRTHRDSTIKNRGRALDSLIRHWRDSVIKAWKDSTHRGRPIIAPENGGSENIGKQSMAFVTPNDALLSQNYPNPVSSSSGTTSIDFSLPNDGAASLAVYNTAGMRVMTLTSGAMSAGQHHVDFDASSLAPGIYFYTLATEAGSLTKRMVKLH